MSVSLRREDERHREGPRGPQAIAGAVLEPRVQKLRDRVEFYEKVWSGSERGVVQDTMDPADVEELERKLENERRVEHNRLEEVKLRRTPTSSPRRVVDVGPGESYQETVTRTVEEGDIASGMRSLKSEKITITKTIRQITSSSSTTTLHTISPSEERILEDSAYQTHSNGNLSMSHSNSSSVSSFTGRSPSEENLRRTPSREMLKDECDSGSGSSKVTSSSSEWYNEYMSQSFQNTSKLEYVRSKSQYDDRIAVIRGQQYVSLLV